MIKLRSRRADLAGSVDMAAQVGQVALPSPVMTAAGTAGHGAELADYLDLGLLGAHVVKSLSAQPWDGNPAPRVAGVDGGMINSIGLQNPGVGAWLEHELPALEARGARVVASIWGFRISDYEHAASALAEAAGQRRVVAVEVNVSCPNIEDRRHMFAHSCEGAAAVVRIVRAALPPGTAVWAKLSPNVTSLTDIAGAVIEAGADAVTLCNTVMGLRIDIEARRAALGAGGGGVSGPAIRPVAVRAVYECRRAFPDVPVVGVGGIATAEHAVEMLMAGANAIQVGTATFLDPRAPARIAAGIEVWCQRHGVRAVRDLIGAAQ